MGLKIVLHNHESKSDKNQICLGGGGGGVGEQLPIFGPEFKFAKILYTLC